MTLPLQVVSAEPALAPTVEAVLARRLARGAAGVVACALDAAGAGTDAAARVGRQARALLEATGARGEGGFARLVVGRVDDLGAGPTPVVTLRLAWGPEASDDGAAHIPEAIGPRRLGPRERLEVAASFIGLVVDLAGAADAGPALKLLAEAIGPGCATLVGAARFDAARLREALAARLAREVAGKLADAVRGSRASDASAVDPGGFAFDELTARLDGLVVDPGRAEPLADRAAVDGPELARALAATAMAEAEDVAARVRREVEGALAGRGLAAMEPLRRGLDGLARAVDTRLGALPAAPPSALEAPSRAALEAAERAVAELAPPIRGAWPLEAAVALGGSVVAAVAVAPVVAPALADAAGSPLARIPGGGATLVAVASLGLWATSALAVRVAQAARARRARRALADAESHHAEASRLAARAWLGPLAALASRRALRRLERALAAERARLRDLASGVDALIARGQAAEVSGYQAIAGLGLDVAVDLGPARDVLAEPAEPLYRRVEAEARAGALPSPSALVDLARATYAGLSDGLPLAARSDLAAALRQPTRAAMSALRAELARWLPDGTPARRFAALPRELADAAPDGGPLDEPLTSAGDGWVLALWRSA